MKSRTDTKAEDRDTAFRAFARPRAAPLHRTAYLLCGDWHLAEDLVQETLAKVYLHWHRVRGVENPDAYVRRILLNEARAHWRRRHVPVLSPAETDYREPALDGAEDQVVRRAELLQALLRLSGRQRATVVLRYVDGLTERETAAVLGCSEGTVKSQASRALTALRKHLAREESWT
jgi:RNA polymerase sigma-70 factor (sigma-E family)